MHSALLHAHSGLRWIALGLILVAVINALLSMSGGLYQKKDKMINLFAMVFMHVQLLIGLVLYFISPKVSFQEGWMKTEMFRFFGMEHLIGMVLAVLLVTLGRKRAEKLEIPSKKHRKILVMYGLALLLVILFIPWPIRENLGGQWM